MFSREDLEHVAQLVEKYNAYAVLDEVYEHLVFDGAQHLTMRTFPGMEDRAIRIGSAGKTFSFTGWKVCSPLSARNLKFFKTLRVSREIGSEWKVK